MFFIVGISTGILVYQYRSIDAARERRKRLSREYLVPVLSCLALIYAVMFSAINLYLVYIVCRMMIGVERWDPMIFLVMLLLEAISVFLAWLGLRLGREWSLLDRCIRAWHAGVSAFSSTPLMADEQATSKPPPHDLA
jgi:hypothetical protein